MPPRRSGLGRGLDALLPTGRDMHEGSDSSTYREVPPDTIDVNPRQPRHNFDEANIADLAVSVSELGILQPLLVRENGTRFELVAGERRLRAARIAQLERVPVLVVETDDRGSLERALVENIHREDLDPLEEAAAYRALLDDSGMTQEELGERLGKSGAAISNTLRLMELPTPIQRLLVDKRMTEGHARALLGLQGHPLQERASRSVVTDGMSVRATEALVRRYREKFAAPGGSTTGEKTAPSAAALETQRLLTDRLQAKVRVEVSKRKRRILIDATSDEDLSRITGVILGREAGGSAIRVAPE
ncbi:MAG TPA: ParB/RepB/Spo0J family partition protein [Actinomycetota bacterium]|nr:ParB/RepB/Spo0J family partition protein [Actinomycetota bacterium]